MFHDCRKLMKFLHGKLLYACIPHLTAKPLSLPNVMSVIIASNAATYVLHRQKDELPSLVAFQEDST